MTYRLDAEIFEVEDLDGSARACSAREISIIGQPVQVKISAYDFGRYGSVDGVLESLSATTFVSDRGERFYRGRIRLARNHVGSDPAENPILPGMTVMADIVTGETTVLEYLLKPIQISLKTAFSER